MPEVSGETKFLYKRKLNRRGERHYGYSLKNLHSITVDVGEKIETISDKAFSPDKKTSRRDEATDV